MVFFVRFVIFVVFYKIGFSLARQNTKHQTHITVLQIHNLIARLAAY